MGVSLITAMQLCNWQYEKGAIRYMIGRYKKKPGFGFIFEFWKNGDFHGPLISSNASFPSEEIARAVARRLVRDIRRHLRWDKKSIPA